MAKLKMWQNSYCDKTQIMTNLKLWKNQTVTKLLLPQNSNCEKLKWCKTQVMTKLKLWRKNFSDEIVTNKYSDITQNVITQMVTTQTVTTQIVTKIKLWQNYFYHETQIVKKSNGVKLMLWQNSNCEVKTLMVKLWQKIIVT